ncbi:MAG: hypothetical protein PF588_09085, partial [Candidatus Kapabacteria bacterium]|nr:hypothetical protein [Candidatus Kapabacteria bacterium]
MNKIVGILVFILAVSQSFAEELNMPFMDKNSMGVHQFIKSNPNADGRDVVIFILDTGVDPLIKGLTTSGSGKTKVLDMQDFSGQLTITLHIAEEEKLGEDKCLNHDETVRVSGFEKLEYKPGDDVYYIG